MSYRIICDQCGTATTGDRSPDFLSDWWQVRKPVTVDTHFCSLECVAQWATAKERELVEHT